MLTNTERVDFTGLLAEMTMDAGQVSLVTGRKISRFVTL
jgi:hypothetical protein